MPDLHRRLIALEERVALLELRQLPPGAPQECQLQQCTYFTHYGVYYDHEKHGERLGHVSYHHAEKKCEEVQKKLMDWMDAHPDKKVPEHMEQQASYWELKICA